MSATISENHEFTVGDGARLEVQNRAGNVSVAKGAAGQMRVVVTKRARGLMGGATEADLERLQVEVTQSGDTVRVITGRGVDTSLFKHITVDLDITVPATVDLDLRLNAGNTRVHDITCGLRAEMNAGNVDLIGVTIRGASQLTLNAGNLTLRGTLAEGATLETQVNAGNARFAFPADAGIAVEAKTTAGSLHSDIEQIRVSRHFASASASGTIGASRGARLRATVNAGSLSFDRA